MQRLLLQFIMPFLGISTICNFAYATEAITIHPGPAPVSIDDPLEAQESVNTTPGNTSFVDDKEWSNQRAQAVKDITDYIPGIIDQPRDGAESSRLSLRGSGLANIFQGSGLMVMQDGIPITMADGEFEFPVIDPWLIKYTQVFPGANALQYGASNFGGAINFITPTGSTGNGYDVRGEFGSFRTWHSMVSAGRQWEGGDVFAAVSGFAQDGFRIQNQQDTSRVNANLGWQPNENFTNRIYINHTHSDAEIPGAISLNELYHDPSQANPVNSAKNYQRDLDMTRIADKSAWQDGDNRIDTAIFYTYRTLDNPVTTYEFQNTSDMGTRVWYTHQFGQNKWLAGFNEYYGTGDENRFQDINATPGAHIVSRNLEALTSEVYTEYEQHLMDKLYAIADLQGSLATRDIEQTFPATLRQDERYGGFNPRIGLRYDMGSEQQLFANLSRSFEPPTWSDLVGNTPGFTQLKAQRSTTVELGTRFLVGNLHWQAAYYHGWLHDELVNYRFADGDTATINAPRTKKDGIELGLEGDLKQNIVVGNDAVSLRSAYTFSHFTLDHDALYGNNVLPGVPEHYVRAELLYRHPSGVSFGPNVEWSPVAAPVDLTNTLYTDSYAIYGIRSFWESANKELNIYIEARNIFNKDYIATYNVVPDASGHDGSYFYPGEGKAIYAGFHWKL